MHSLTKLLFTSVLLMASSTLSLAAPTNTPDNKQPVNIQADQLQASEKAGKSIYSGNVVVTQGSLTIKGDQIEVLHPKGKLSQAITTGTPAIFKRYNQTEKAWVNGKANRIEYDTKAKTVLLIGDAEVEQPGKHKISGSKLFYDLEKQLLNANSSPEDKKRVSVTFTPETDSKQDNDKTAE